MSLRKLMNGWAILACSVALVVGPLGCGHSAAVPETHVARVELFRTGNLSYDEFFEDLYGLQGSSKGAVEEEKSARGKLGQTLGVGDTSMDRVLQALKAKAEEHAQGKGRVHFNMENVDEQGRPLAGKQIAVTPTSAKGRVPKDASEFAAAIELSAKAEGQLWEKYAPAPDKARRLSEKATALRATVDADFATESKPKREEISRELDAAKAAADEIAGRCDKVMGSTVRFLKEGPEILTAAAQVEPKAAPAKPGKGRGGKGDKADKGDKGDKADKGEKGDRAERPAKADKPAKAEKPEKAEKADKPEKPEKAEKPKGGAAPAKAPPGEGSADFNP